MITSDDYDDEPEDPLGCAWILEILLALGAIGIVVLMFLIRGC